MIRPQISPRPLHVVLPPSQTQYSGQDVLLIAPDSYTLSALQAAALGVDMKLHAMYSLGPGEVGTWKVSPHGAYGLGRHVDGTAQWRVRPR